MSGGFEARRQTRRAEGKDKSGIAPNVGRVCARTISSLLMLKGKFLTYTARLTSGGSRAFSRLLPAASIAAAIVDRLLAPLKSVIYRPLEITRSRPRVRAPLIPGLSRPPAVLRQAMSLSRASDGDEDGRRLLTVRRTVMEVLLF